MISSAALPEMETGVRLARPEDAPKWAKIQIRALRRGIENALGQVSPEQLALFQEADITAAWQQAISVPPSAKHHLLTANTGGEVVGFAAIAPVEAQIPSAPQLGGDPENSSRPAQGKSEEPAQARAEMTCAEMPQAEATQVEKPKDLAEAANSPEPVADQGSSETPLINIDAEIVALEVADFQQQNADAARLLNALSDVLRKSGAKRVQVWLLGSDEEKIRFYSESGFVPAGIRQKFQIGEKILDQHLWYTEFKDD